MGEISALPRYNLKIWLTDGSVLEYETEGRFEITCGIVQFLRPGEGDVCFPLSFIERWERMPT